MLLCGGQLLRAQSSSIHAQQRTMLRGPAAPPGVCWLIEQLQPQGQMGSSGTQCAKHRIRQVQGAEAEATSALQQLLVRRQAGCLHHHGARL